MEGLGWIWERFQSHAGSIEAIVKPGDPIPIIAFQSHAGSIEAVPDGHGEAVVRVVSIPRWFD